MWFNSTIVKVINRHLKTTLQTTKDKTLKSYSFSSNIFFIQSAPVLTLKEKSHYMALLYNFKRYGSGKWNISRGCACEISSDVFPLLEIDTPPPSTLIFHLKLLLELMCYSFRSRIIWQSADLIQIEYDCTTHVFLHLFALYMLDRCNTHA